jgi:8-oxo-dGTP pyrophosphatase MutT (NUDIX family)
LQNVGRARSFLSKYPPLVPWHVLERRLLLSRSHLTLWEDRVRLANGREIDDFCVIDSPDWAAVLCRTTEGRVVLVRQYRHGQRGESLELPAGALEPSEEPLAAAKRELLEETGYASEHWRPLLEASLDPARASGRAHFYAALDAQRIQAPRFDPTEDIHTLLVSGDELLHLVDTGQIAHGIHIAAVLMAHRGGLL